MSVKLKVKFTIEAQTLFALASKLLPIADLSIEELAPEHEKAIAKTTQQVARIAKPKRTSIPRYSTGPNLKAGINGIIVTHLSDGLQHQAMEFRSLLEAAGYSKSSVSSRLEELRKLGVVENTGSNTWRLKDGQTTGTDTRNEP